MKNEVQNWLQSGSNPIEGVKLLEKYSKNVFLIRLIKSHPSKNIDLLIQSLCQLSGAERPKVYSGKKQTVTRVAFREEFPFLEKPDCPMELKALVTDKFSSFRRYVKLHDKLFDCTSLDECTETANELLSNYRDNRAIYAELNYYKQHHAILGKHPIFKHFNHLKDLKNMNIRELIKKEEKLQHNIWRIESEIAKGDKPELLAERKQRLELKQNELAEVQRLLS